MTVKIILAFLLALIAFTLLPTDASARRLLPRAVPATGATRSGGTITTSGPGVKVRFRPDRLAIIATFSNINQATSVSYLFSYNSRGTTQGAQGSVNTAEANTTREIIFGTCSHGVCRYDYGISGAKFVVTMRLPNGKKIVKTFRLKV